MSQPMPPYLRPQATRNAVRPMSGPPPQVPVADVEEESPMPASASGLGPWQKGFLLLATVGLVIFGLDALRQTVPEPPPVVLNGLTPLPLALRESRMPPVEAGMIPAGNVLTWPPADPLQLHPLPEKNPDADLQAVLDEVVASAPRQITPHIYVLNLATGGHASVRGDLPAPAASVIKLPVLLAYLDHISAQPSLWEQPLRYDPIHVASGSGELQYSKPDRLLSPREVATAMIQTSDNSATNILIDTLGGAAFVNRRLERMGLSQTHLRNWLPDLEGTNVLSPRDMAQVLHTILNTDRLTPEFREEARRILTGVRNNRLIPAGLPRPMEVAHKTGDIGTSLGDSALITRPDGQQYLLCVQVERPYNDYAAKAFIIDLSRRVYEAISGQRTAQINTPG